MKRPWIPLHVPDYRGDTARLSTAEHGAYLLLIMEYWVSGGLPDDDKQLARIVYASPAEWKRLRPVMLNFFKEGWKHKRIDDELQKAGAISDKRREAAQQKHAVHSAKAHANAPPLARTPYTQQGDDDEDARAKPPLIRPEAFELSEEIAKLCGHDPHFVPTSWCGAPHRVEMWLVQGWTRDQVIPAVTSALAKKHGKAPVSIQYFEKPIAEFIAKMSRPLPEVVVDNTAEKIHVRPSTTSAVIAAADRLVERLASFDEPAPSDLRSGEGAQPIRAISQG